MPGLAFDRPWDESMTQEQKRTFSVFAAQKSAVDSKREERYTFPAVYRQYIELRIKKNGTFIRADLDNFSRGGILFESPVPFDTGSFAECVISASRSLSKEIVFGIRVKHCRRRGTTFLVGAAVETVADAVWFNIFLEVHDFIIARQGSVY